MTEFEINFRPGGNSALYVGEGWGEVEPAGRWMVGQQSRLTVPPPPWPHGAFRGRAVLGPFIKDGAVPEQRLAIVVNGVLVGQWRLTHVMELDFDIPADVILDGAASEIVMRHEDAVAPARFEAGGDVRELSLSVWSMTLFGPDRPPDAPPAMPRRTSEAAVFRLRSRGNLGNRMIEFMVGLSVQRLAPDCVLSGIELDEWGLSTHGDQPPWADHAVVDEQIIDVAAVAARLRAPQTRKIAWRGYGQRMENFLQVETYRDVFRAPALDVVEYDERYLVINVRAGDVLSGAIRDYVLMPPNFYRDLIERTRLIPVFMGQLQPSAYTDALRAACPQARFVMSQGPMLDFETVRRAKNIVVSVSTFSWLAAWLSHATRIFLPVNGIFNPLQYPAIDLLPLDDRRYEFSLFPVNHAVPLGDLAASHRAIDGQWRIAAPGELALARI